MKKIILCTMLMAIGATTFCQETNPTTPLTRADYLLKSKKQKTFAWILAGTGVGVMVVAVATVSEKDAANYLFQTDNSGFNTSATLFAIGGIISLSSIPLFIASGRNKRKGMRLTFKNERTPQIHKSSFVYRYVPSLSLKISLIHSKTNI